ncbi:MAG: HNH endonuclease [Chloroflexi bacterium]|nr:HNH endonuclease [Chloroflexota bacterium]
MTISTEKRQIIRETYDHRCGYCGVSESDIGGELQIDHYQPIARNGEDSLNNLIYACVHCNRFKGDYWPNIDDPDSFHILHPEKDDIALHLQVTSSGRVEGLTPRGWFHINRLQLNRPQLIVWRQNWQRYRRMEATLNQSKEITIQLQQRIHELEQEAISLRHQIARLTGAE